MCASPSLRPSDSITLCRALRRSAQPRGALALHARHDSELLGRRAAMSGVSSSGGDAHGQIAASERLRVLVVAARKLVRKRHGRLASDVGAWTRRCGARETDSGASGSGKHGIARATMACHRRAAPCLFPDLWASDTPTPAEELESASRCASPPRLLFSRSFAATRRARRRLAVMSDSSLSDAGSDSPARPWGLALTRVAHGLQRPPRPRMPSLR